MKSASSSKQNLFLKGLTDGLPIGLGYLSVSFAFGLYTFEQGLKIWQTVMMSMTNLTSAGQLAGVTAIVAAASLSELAFSQFVINIRYSLMSVTLSQKFDNTIKLGDRFFFSFFVTDEIFAVASSRASVGKKYMSGIIILPYIGWSLGTLLGAFFGDILPETLVSALGIAIYGMFIAIIVPAAKKNAPVLGAIIIAASVNCIIRFTPLHNYISNGLSVIIAALIGAIILAVLRPVDDDDSEEATIDE